MAKRRPGIPRRRTDEILFASNHTCCVCRVAGKDVQIHHIDGNHSHNQLVNLAVVCLDCHSKVSGTRGLGKAYSSGEVRRYKRAWEQQVRESRGVHQPKIKYKTELISRVDLIVCEILALRRGNPRAKELLNTLYELHLWRGSHRIDRAIIEGLGHLALMTGLAYPQLAGPVAEKLWEMCFHLVGPDRVPMDRQDEQQVMQCVDALDTLARFNSEFGHGRRAMRDIVKTAANLFEISLWYSRRRIANAVLRVYAGALTACAPEGKVEFQEGHSALRRSLRAIDTLTEEQEPAWRNQRRRIRELLA
jgi:hypothetical protein